MELLEELQSLYTGYLLKTEQLERDRKPADGLLGMAAALPPIPATTGLPRSWKHCCAGWMRSPLPSFFRHSR